jgi:hypothetical protein
VRAVKRSHERFPSDFIFQLSDGEFENLRFHFGTSSSWGGRRYPPYAFTEHGVAMLSSVLRSARAVQVNIAIMRAFVRLRQTLALHKELAATVAELERKIESHDEGIRTLFEAIRQWMDTTPPPTRKAIGFHVKEAGPVYRVRRRRARGGRRGRAGLHSTSTQQVTRQRKPDPSPTAARCQNRMPLSIV